MNNQFNDNLILVKQTQIILFWVQKYYFQNQVAKQILILSFALLYFSPDDSCIIFYKNMYV